jgi:transposase InsO family protein
VCQRVRKPYRRDEMPLAVKLTSQVFEKWAIDFVGPINPLGKCRGDRYIIIATKYLTRWEEERAVKDYSANIAMQFIFEDIINIFGCSKILMSDKGTHFIKKIIEALTQEFKVHHQKRTPYHPQANGTIEAFNNILETMLFNICSVNRDNWDLRIPSVLWSYRTNFNNLIMRAPFKLAYGLEAVVPMKYLVPTLRIVAFTGMDNTSIVQDRLTHLLELEEDRLISKFHQQVQKYREKDYHDKHIKKKLFKKGDLVFLYDIKFMKNPGKLRTHWLGPFEVSYVRKGGDAQLKTPNGEWK